MLHGHRTADQNAFASPNALLALHRQRTMLEAKALAINRVCTNLLAVAANDAFVRVYDRRMLSPGTMQWRLWYWRVCGIGVCVVYAIYILV